MRFRLDGRSPGHVEDCAAGGSAGRFRVGNIY